MSEPQETRKPEGFLYGGVVHTNTLGRTLKAMEEHYKLFPEEYEAAEMMADYVRKDLEKHFGTDAVNEMQEIKQPEPRSLTAKPADSGARILDPDGVLGLIYGECSVEQSIRDVASEVMARKVDELLSDRLVSQEDIDHCKRIPNPFDGEDTGTRSSAVSSAFRETAVDRAVRDPIYQYELLKEAMDAATNREFQVAGILLQDFAAANRRRRLCQYQLRFPRTLADFIQN